MFPRDNNADAAPRRVLIPRFTTYATGWRVRRAARRPGLIVAWATRPHSRGMDSMAQYIAWHLLLKPARCAIAASSVSHQA